MSTFKLVTCRELPIANIEGKYYLLDTLCPKSSLNGSIMIDGSDFANSLDFRQNDEDERVSLTKKVGTRIDGILGTDFLGNFFTIFDYRGGIFHISRHVREFSGLKVNGLDAKLKPIIKISIDGEEKRVLLSTGFGISYFSNICVSSNDWLLRDYRDSASLQVEHITDVFQKEAFLDASRINLRVAKNMPQGLEGFLQGANVDGIVGYDFLSQFKICLNPFDTTFSVYGKTN
jgi:hypothetical protein